MSVYIHIYIYTRVHMMVATKLKTMAQMSVPLHVFRGEDTSDSLKYRIGDLRLCRGWPALCVATTYATSLCLETAAGA